MQSILVANWIAVIKTLISVLSSLLLLIFWLILCFGMKHMVTCCFPTGKHFLDDYFTGISYICLNPVKPNVSSTSKVFIVELLTISQCMFLMLSRKLQNPFAE